MSFQGLLDIKMRSRVKLNLPVSGLPGSGVWLDAWVRGWIELVLEGSFFRGLFWDPNHRDGRRSFLSQITVIGSNALV